VDEALEYPYAVAAEYFPDLPRDQFEAWATDHGLAQLEWDRIVGKREGHKQVARFYRERFGYLFHMIREIVPAGTWGPLEDRANIVRQYLKAAGLGSVLDFGGGVGGTAQQLARWDYAVGLVEVGHMLDFARWYCRRQGLAAGYDPADGAVRCYRHLSQARSYPWEAFVAIDVLEHCWEPVDLLKSFADALPSGGLLIATHHSFKAHPMHLSRTFWLFEDLGRVLGILGLEAAYRPDPHYGIGAWRKPA
jgi:2-polyprenyl-3-methyl-5-hydroxy-6-metoxy-1,4-benzoquinol methylase